jgi:hypothetical protein
VPEKFLKHMEGQNNRVVQWLPEKDNENSAGRDKDGR